MRLTFRRGLHACWISAKLVKMPSIFTNWDNSENVSSFSENQNLTQILIVNQNRNLYKSTFTFVHLVYKCECISYFPIWHINSVLLHYHLRWHIQEHICIPKTPIHTSWFLNILWRFTPLCLSHRNTFFNIATYPLQFISHLLQHEFFMASLQWKAIHPLPCPLRSSRYNTLFVGVFLKIKVSIEIIATHTGANRTRSEQF